MKTLIKGGRILDPATGHDAIGDLWIQDGKIESITPPGAKAPQTKDHVISAAGLAVAPGLVDMHVHLREPGAEYKETIASGTRAAAAGGITSVACMPNTDPPIDNLAMVELVLSKAKYQGVVNVYPVACVTRGREGKVLTEMGELKAAGVVAVSDDGDPVSSPALMRCALQYAGMLDLLMINHAEDKGLSGKGVAHAGFQSMLLGLSGIPRSALEVMIARDLILAEETGSRIHVPHVSTEGGVRMIREAKARGVLVTAETAPHYLVLTDDSLQGYDTNVRVNPPLAEQKDQEALLAGLRDGTIDAIATDHAPHSRREKEMEFALAAPGICGLETSLSLILTALVETKILTLLQAVQCMSFNPARILKIPKGTLKPGADADVVVFNPQAERVIRASAFLSQADNTPFDGWKVKGEVVMTLVGGRSVFENNEHTKAIHPA
ncbi:dihydroorotase [candidate division FCPU426 bacterium]|nr:dihydroorotase [candidate division FCPU426 bacterium]